MGRRAEQLQTLMRVLPTAAAAMGRAASRLQTLAPAFPTVASAIPTVASSMGKAASQVTMPLAQVQTFASEMGRTAEDKGRSAVQLGTALPSHALRAAGRFEGLGEFRARVERIQTLIEHLRSFAAQLPTLAS